MLNGLVRDGAKTGDSPVTTPSTPNGMVRDASVDQPMPQAAPQGGGNQLMALLQQAKQQQQPQPLSYDQTMAAVHHLQAVEKVMKPLLTDPSIGKSNIRPKVFDACADLMGEQIMSLADVMNAIKTLPDDPVDQKKWVEKIVRTSAMGVQKVTDEFMQNENGLEEAKSSQWSPDTHGDHMKAVRQRYPYNG